LRLTLPAKQVHGCGTQSRGRVRSVPEYGRTIWRPRQLCKGYPAVFHRRRRRAEWKYHNSRAEVMYVTIYLRGLDLHAHSEFELGREYAIEPLDQSGSQQDFTGWEPYGSPCAPDPCDITPPCR
jgi:hypothetical protein